ncbi:hypothetical protein GCM10007049_36630 [Echinicola pacifica]|uniref:DUF1684 domain-containing protein n=1 Tax=Echinicola pacifica TaxID=346377 RepID=A0A918QAP0_9BACT|nr:DUF1684 domain-containing protein [Echinicola pacifica]GGZ39901.1 hypothetical protein GCM10007049_36630 [Echinicola pacifica]
MNQKRVLLTIGGLIAVTAIFYMFSGGADVEDYKARVLAERTRQFKFLKFNDESPLTPDQKKELDSLDCFDVAPEYKVRARLVPLQERQVLEIPMTDGTQEKYLKHSYAEFELNGKALRLLLLQSVTEPDKKNFFLPFADKTSGESTYGGGRYLNIRQDGFNSITLDFNLAYNPYCAYNPDFACPIPPKENLLEVAIEAGEKNYSK